MPKNIGDIFRNLKQYTLLLPILDHHTACSSIWRMGAAGVPRGAPASTAGAHGHGARGAPLRVRRRGGRAQHGDASVELRH